LKIGACQFAVTDNVEENFAHIKNAVFKASAKNVRLLLFPECALTGYPPLKIASPQSIDFNQISYYSNKLRELAVTYAMYLFVGSVIKEKESFYNSILVFSPEGEPLLPYHKRGLWGWDADNFKQGDNNGIYEIDGYRIGIRICYEIRFPEYFRELYKADTDINLVSFCDISDTENLYRYKLLRSILRTRAMENICPILCVNDCSLFQTAPSAFINEEGDIAAELQRNKKGLLIYDFERSDLSFGAIGRKTFSDKLTD